MQKNTPFIYSGDAVVWREPYPNEKQSYVRFQPDGSSFNNCSQPAHHFAFCNKASTIQVVPGPVCLLFYCIELPGAAFRLH